MLPLRRRSSGAARSGAVAIGRAAERRARFYYALRGYRVLAANAWAGGNELDLVLRRGQRLVFCEVKLRSRTDFGEPAEMVGSEKRRRVRRAAEIWLAAHPDLADFDVSFDVVAIHEGRVERLADAF